jgi:hypothetical protein
MPAASATITALDRFRRSLTEPAPPARLNHSLQALWWDAKGDWERAHSCVQNDEGEAASLVHAYLHRKEGDASNAAYWYRRAGRKPAHGTLAAEWAAIAGDLLDQAVER